MKNKFNLIGSIILMIIGLAAVASFIIMSVNGEIEWKKYLVGAILSILFILIGIKDIIKYKKSEKKIKRAYNALKRLM